MTLRLTPDVLAAAYDFLRHTPPFKGWRLPESDEIAFHVVRDPTIHADFGVDNDGGPLIRVSATCNGHTITLLQSMAHEIVHLRQHLIGAKDAHGASFKRMAKAVCAAHGFDIKVF